MLLMLVTINEVKTFVNLDANSGTADPIPIISIRLG